jgi:hypothetical protein
MARPRAAPGTECETVRCGRAGCVAVEGEGSCALGDDYLGSDCVSRYCFASAVMAMVIDHYVNHIN